jgi:hypothetical protein
MYPPGFHQSSLRTANLNGFTGGFSTDGIIVIVISSLFGLMLCIGSIISVVSLIKHWNQPKYSKRQGQVVCPSGYCDSWSTQHLSSVTSVTNPNAVEYEVYRPIYIVSAADPTKAPPT